MVGKILIAILALFLLFGAFATSIFDGIKGWRTEDTTQNFIVTTAGGITTSNVTLSAELYQDDVTEVIAVSSSETESPVATAYDDDTQNLLISALDASTTRTITVNYFGETDSLVMKAIGPFLGFLIVGGLAFAVLWAAWKGKRN